MILLATLVAVVATADSLVILTNFLVAFSTLLLWAASEREQHQTFKAIIAANSRVVRALAKALGSKNKE